MGKALSALTSVWVAGLVTGFAGPAAAREDAWQACIGGDVYLKLSACTHIIPSLSERNRVVAYYNRGLAHHQKADYDRAIRDFDEAIRLDPKYAHAYYNRGLAHHQKADYDRAIRDFDEAIRLDPKYAHAHAY